MGIRNIENLTAVIADYAITTNVGRVYDEDSPAVEQDLMVDHPTEEEIKVVTLAIEAKRWRDQELKSTDTLSLLADHPNNANILLYRQELRDWPNTSTFPLTKPTLN